MACRRGEERIDGTTDRYVNKKKTHAKPRFFTHAHSGNGWIDFNQILHIDSLGGRSDIFEAASKLVQGLGRGRGVKFPLSHWLYHWLLTLRIALPRIRVIFLSPVSNRTPVLFFAIQCVNTQPPQPTLKVYYKLRLVYNTSIHYKYGWEPGWVDEEDTFVGDNDVVVVSGGCVGVGLDLVMMVLVVVVLVVLMVWIV